MSANVDRVEDVVEPELLVAGPERLGAGDP